MDKNNDIQVNKVSKWEAAPVSIKNLRNYISESWVNYAAPPCCPPLDPSCQDSICESMMTLLESILDDYNELEAKHQKDTGMISEYEEENTKLSRRKSKLDIMNDCLITRVFKQEAENKDLQKTCKSLEKVILKLQNEYNSIATENAKLRSQCQSKEEELRIREKEKDEKDKLIDELNSEIKMLKLSTKMMYGCYGLNPFGELNRKIEALEKENKELKDTLAKDREFGKYVGKLVADSIREGCDKGIYELHPHMRIDIHVEETNNMPMTFDRHAIPRIAVMFNNTQTEMERDTAEHECEELDRKFKELVKENEELRMTLAMCERDSNMARELCHNVAFNAERARNKMP